MIITADDILRKTTFEKILTDCGCQKIKRVGNAYVCRSPFHKDIHPSFAFYPNKLHWCDFSGNISGGSLDYLLRLKLNVTLADYLDLNLSAMADNVWKSKCMEKFPDVNYKCLVTGSMYAVTKEHKEAYIYAVRKRNMNLDFIREFGISFGGSDCYVHFESDTGEIGNFTYFGNRLMIPICDKNGKVISYEGRRINDNDSVIKVVYPSSLNGETGTTKWSLFNYHRLDFNKPLIVCEGIMDLPVVWRIYKNVTCTYGSAFKEKHKLEFLNFKNIILMADSDKGGERMRNEYDKVYKDSKIKIWHCRVPEGKDPGECTVDEIKKSLNHLVCRNTMERSNLNRLY